MNDAPEQKDNENGAEEAPAGPLAGQRLAEARRKQDIAAAEIAKELHLDEPKIRALEDNDFAVLGAPVFVKGHLRKYAELVGVPIKDVLADYYELTRGTAGPPVVTPSRRRPERELNLGRWIAAIVALALAGAAAYWGIGQIDMAAEPPANAVRPVPPTTEPVADEAPATADPEDRAGEPAERVTEPAAEAPVTPAPDAAAASPAEEPPEDDTGNIAPAAAPPVAVGGSAATGPSVSLTMTFSGDCWTEVTDADGERLFFDLGREGRTVRVSGSPPLRVLFGSSDNVRLEVDGREFPIPDFARRGDTARLTINSQ